jgi:hypothetical protein
MKQKFLGHTLVLICSSYGLLVPSFKSNAAAIDPEKVQVVEQKPNKCRFVAKIEVDGSRLLPALQGDRVGRRAVKKAKNELEDTKEKAADLGADTLLIPRNGAALNLISGSLETYNCGVPGALNANIRDSEKERSNKRFVADLEVIGIATPLDLGSGFTLGMHLGTNQIVEVNAAFASAEKGDESTLANDSAGSYDFRADGSSSIVGARYKRFVTNSFYWHGGFTFRQTKASLYAVETYGSKATEVAALDNSDIGGSFAIGNQWQWSTFNLGCDWIGLYLPFIKSKNEYTAKNETEVSSSSGDSARSDFKKKMEGLNIQGARFYLGASF